MSQTPPDDVAAVRGRPGRVPSLDRTTIVRAALHLIDTQGIGALSMRRLGTEMGVEGMALYRYVGSRDSLLDAVVEHVIDEMYGDPDVHLLPHDGWVDYLTRLAHGVRRIALAHPEAFPLIATRPPVAPWLRPPLRSLRWVDSFFEGLQSRDFTAAGATSAYRAFTSFLLGHLLLEVAALGVTTGPAEAEPEEADPPLLVLEEYPHVAAVIGDLSEDRSGEEFETSLQNLLDRLKRDIGPG